MSDSAAPAAADAIYPGGPSNAPAAAPTAAPARATTPAPVAAEATPAPAAEAAAPAAADTDETTPTLLTEKEAEPEKPEEPAPTPFDAEKLTLPEGMKPDDETLGKFSEIATKGKLSQETAQELITLYHSVAGAQAKQNWDSWQTTQAGWVAEVKADRELGNLDEVKRITAAVLDNPEFATPKTREGFEVTGAGNHPEVIRLVYRLAKAVAEGTHVAGNGPVRQATERSLAERIYPNLSAER